MKSVGKPAKRPVARAPSELAQPQRKKAALTWPKLLPEPKCFFPPLFFFLVYFVSLWGWVDVKLIYHSGGLVKDFPAFYWGREFGRDFQTHPGGLVEYASALFAQALYSSWWGALVLTLQAAILYASAAGSLRNGGSKKLGFIAYVPPLLLLGIYSQYRHYSAPIASFTAGLASGWVCLRLCSRFPRWRLAWALLLQVCLYAAAPSALLVFLPIVAVAGFPSATIRNSRWPDATAPLEPNLERRQTPPGASAFSLGSFGKLLFWFGLSGLLPPLEGTALFGFGPGESYSTLLPLPWDPIAWKMTAAWLVAALYLLAPALCLATFGWRIARALRLHRTSAKRDSLSAKASVVTGPKRPDPHLPQTRKTSSAPRIAWWKYELAGAVLLPMAAVWLGFHSQTKAFLLVDYLAWNGRWAEVPAAAQSNPRNPFVACVVAQASYHNGTLTSALPPLGHPADLLLSDEKQQSHWRKSDLYYDLGYLNMALHHLTESVEFYGERPVLLRRLALVNLALGNYSTAKVYLGTLSRAPFQGAWARDYLGRLATDPTLGSDAEVGRLRRLMVKRDSVVVLSDEEQLLMLLAANRQNRMAFEYLMTYYLLTKNLRAFATNIARVHDFAGFEISPLWDEALLLGARESGHPVEVPGHTFSPEAASRVDAVIRLARQFASNQQISPAEFAANYVHTYSYYWCFAP